MSLPVESPLSSMDAMHAWAKANLGDLFDGAQGRTLGIEATFVRTLKDGLSRIEFGVWMITQGLGSPRDLVDSISRVHARMAPQVEWIPQLGLSRHCQLSWLQESGSFEIDWISELAAYERCSAAIVRRC